MFHVSTTKNTLYVHLFINDKYMYITEEKAEKLHI